MICIIPARGGSTRIPKKNIKEFHGKPIIAYSIETAQESGLFNEIYVSSDSDEILEISKSYGAKSLPRSAVLSENDVSTQTVMQYGLRQLELLNKPDDICCCLYPCSPLLSTYLLNKGINELRYGSYAEYSLSIGINPLRDAGNYYFGRIRAFVNGEPIHGTKSIMVPLPEERVCDINTMDDWREAEEKYGRLLEK